MTNQIQVVSFHNQQITVLNHDDKPYIAIKPICENIGLDWEAQRQRIKRNEILNSTAFMIKVVAKDGKNRDVLCLPLGYLNGWLAGIELSRVNPTIKPKLKQYQLECFDVLYNHFMPKVAQQFPNTINEEQQYLIRKAVDERAYRTGEKHQTIYHKFYDQFKITSYKNLPSNKFNEAMMFLGGVYIASSQFTDDELCTLSWCYKAAERMRQHITLVTDALYQIKSDYAPSFYSMGREYKRTLENARVILDRETKHVELNQQGYLSNNWRNVLPNIRKNHLTQF